jgi:hypothetical protein
MALGYPNLPLVFYFILILSSIINWCTLCPELEAIMKAKTLSLIFCTLTFAAACGGHPEAHTKVSSVNGAHIVTEFACPKSTLLNGPGFTNYLSFADQRMGRLYVTTPKTDCSIVVWFLYSFDEKTSKLAVDKVTFLSQIEIDSCAPEITPQQVTEYFNDWFGSKFEAKKGSSVLFLQDLKPDRTIKCHGTPGELKLQPVRGEQAQRFANLVKEEKRRKDKAFHRIVDKFVQDIIEKEKEERAEIAQKGLDPEDTAAREEIEKQLQEKDDFLEFLELLDFSNS